VADNFIFLRSAHEVTTYISKFCFKSHTHDRSQFIAFHDSYIENAQRVVQNVLELFWTRQHKDVLVLVRNKQNVFDVYAWFPLDQSPEVKVVAQCIGDCFR